MGFIAAPYLSLVTLRLVTKYAIGVEFRTVFAITDSS